MSFASSKSTRRLTGALSILISAVLGTALVTAQPAAAAIRTWWRLIASRP